LKFGAGSDFTRSLPRQTKEPRGTRAAQKKREITLNVGSPDEILKEAKSLRRRPFLFPRC